MNSKAEFVYHLRRYTRVVFLAVAGPVLCSIYALALWSVASEIGLAGSFPWSTGSLSNSVLWLAFALIFTITFALIRGKAAPELETRLRSSRSTESLNLRGLLESDASAAATIGIRYACSIPVITIFRAITQGEEANDTARD